METIKIDLTSQRATRSRRLFFPSKNQSQIGKEERVKKVYQCNLRIKEN
jgi:hypothetical protein